MREEDSMGNQSMNIVNPETLPPKLRIDRISQQIQMCAMGFIIDVLDKYSGEFESLYMICPDEGETILKFQDAVNIFYEYISKAEISEHL